MHSALGRQPIAQHPRPLSKQHHSLSSAVSAKKSVSKQFFKHQYPRSDMNLFFLTLLLNIGQTISFSPPNGHAARLSIPSSLQAYHFGQTDTKPQPKQSSKTKRPTSYVPTGLTEEQYAQIKLQDAAKIQGDLGAWGPRWKKVSGDPQGNWFSMPALWTGGYSREAVGDYDLPKWIVGDEEENVGRLRRLLIGCVLGVRRYGLAYLMLLASASYVTILQKQLSMKSVVLRAVVPLLALKPIDEVASMLSMKMTLLREHGVAKLASILAMAVALLSFVLRR
jgi:hypothetical protein